MKKILLTGASGFIGQSCIELLKNSSFEIHAVSRNVNFPQPSAANIVWHACDLLDNEQTKRLLKNIQPDFLIHLAWFVVHQLFWSAEENISHIAATVNLYKEFSALGGAKVIFLGTGAEYAATDDYCDEENIALHPTTLYGLAKKQTFELLTQLKKQVADYSPFNWVRLFNVFGPQENPARLIPHIFKCYFQSQPPHLMNPFAVRDHLYVDNLSEILIALLEKEYQGPLNVGQKIELSNLALAEKIHHRYFKDLPTPTFLNTAPQEMNVYLPNLAKLNHLYIPYKVDFEAGLDKIHLWWSEHFNKT